MSLTKNFQRKGRLGATLIALGAAALSTLGAVVWTTRADAARPVLIRPDRPRNERTMNPNPNETKRLPFEGAAAKPVAELDAELAGKTPRETLEIVATLQNEGMSADAGAVFKRGLVEPVLFDKNADEKLVLDVLRAFPAIWINDRDAFVGSVDEILEKTLETRPENWRIGAEVANCYRVLFENVVFGVEQVGDDWIRSTEFYDGAPRERDRVRGLQILRDALPAVEREFSELADAAQKLDNDAKTEARLNEIAAFYANFARALGSDAHWNYWRRQATTNLDELPGLDEAAEQYWGGGRGGAPVDADGNPVVFAVPESFESAQNDGERIAWLRAQRAKCGLKATCDVLHERANEAATLFGVETLRQYDYFFRDASANADETENATDGVWSLATLQDNETIAKLADGSVKRFAFPESCDYFKLWNEICDVAATALNSEGCDEASRHWFEQTRCSALERIAREYENRRQYNKAADAWGRVIETAQAANGAVAQYVLENAKNARSQIVDPWGRIERARSKVLGTKISLGYVYRNGKTANFVVRKLRTDLLLDDAIQNFVKPGKNGRYPGSLEWTLFQRVAEWANFDPAAEKDGFERPNAEYVGDEVLRKTVELSPAADRTNRVADVRFDDLPAGAYLIESEIENGNRTFACVWTTDVALVVKRFARDRFFFVADAESGAPIQNAELEILNGTWRGGDPRAERNKRPAPKTTRVKTDENGQALVPLSDKVQGDDRNLTLLATVRSNDPKTPERFAFFGFDSVWIPAGSGDDRELFENRRAYFVSDRPIYRPKQTANFKFWVGTAEYDAPEDSVWAGKTVYYLIHSPTGEKVAEKEVVLDEFGGFSDSFEIGADAKLGVYNVQLFANKGYGDYLGDGSFRLEEYRKPEFEVVVDAPKEPVALGDKFKATISAKYYFGGAVANGEVKYTVKRTQYNADWYPIRPWDWFYGNGYWWFWADCDWHPGWAKWGLRRPALAWFPRPHFAPEVVLEGTAPLNADGKLELEIDSALAKAIYPNEDQQYEITAEVVDQSRRTIVGSGKVFAAKSPFKVYVWPDRGFYETGQKIEASFQTRRLDGKPVVGTAKLRLLKIEYEGESEATGIRPVETEVFARTVETDAEGAGRISLSAATPGQYRLSCVVETENGLAEEGAQIFCVRGVNDKFAERSAERKSAGESAFRFGDLELTPDKAEYAVGEKVRLQISAARPDATVLLFPRTQRGVPAGLPQTIKLTNGSAVAEIEVAQSDTPNFFVEAATVSDGVLYSERREIVVPPEKRVLNVEVLPTKTAVRPGEKAKIELRLTDQDGKPVVGQTVATIYDKSLEQLAGPNTSDIREFFWKWRRSCDWSTFDGNLRRMMNVWFEAGKPGMQNIGAFGDEIFVERDGFAAAGGMGGGMTTLNFNAPMKLGAARRSNAVAKSRMTEDAMVLEESVAMDAAPMMAAAPAAMSLADAEAPEAKKEAFKPGEYGAAGAAVEAEPNFVEATVRKNLADLAFWAADLTPNDDGAIEIEVDMPENLTTWKIAAWSVGAGLRVGSGTAEIATRKDVIVRMQKPRFLIRTDEVVLSANVHNYLDAEKTVQVSLEISDEMKTEDVENAELAKPAKIALVDGAENAATRTVVVPAGGETRVDWRVRAESVGTATFTMKALTDEESDAIQDSLPVYEHGTTKQLAVSGTIPAVEKDAKTDAKSSRKATFRMTVPAARRPETTKLTVRFSPTLAGAIFDALPYLTEYPYGCTEQTLNKFLPLVIAQKTLQDMGLDLAQFENRRANLNAQELGTAAERAAQWNRLPKNSAPVFDVAEVRRRADVGVERLTSMQNADGGWGWFYGSGERSQAFLTALVYRGLIAARACDQKVDENVLGRAQNWLRNYQREEALKILRGAIWSDEKKAESGAWRRWKDGADAADAFVYFALSEGGDRPATFEESFVDVEKETIFDSPEATQSVMREYVWNARNELDLFPLSAFALALDAELKAALNASDAEPTAIRIETILRRLSQYRENDDENQTVRLDLNRVNGWRYWCWQGSEFETQAFYLRLLNRVDGETLERLGLENDAPQLVKYLLNNRKNATYWNSTRDAALCVEAFAEYLRETNELAANSKVEVFVDGELRKTVEYTPETIFDVDGTLELTADEIASGDREITLRVNGDGALYYNAYLEFFTLEDPIKKAGLEVKTERAYYKLVERKDATQLVSGGRGQALEQRVEKYDRVALNDGDEIVSGDLIEVVLTVESKNEYESILLEDMKAAGFEPVETKSGYNGNELGAYVEFRDERVCFFVSRLPEGKSSVSYRLRAETPGSFSALPTKIWAMYAPELKGNSDEFKANVSDREIGQTK